MGTGTRRSMQSDDMPLERWEGGSVRSVERAAVWHRGCGTSAIAGLLTVHHHLQRLNATIDQAAIRHSKQACALHACGAPGEGGEAGMAGLIAGAA